jgi:hypothetical protein
MIGLFSPQEFSMPSPFSNGDLTKTEEEVDFIEDPDFKFEGTE